MAGFYVLSLLTMAFTVWVGVTIVRRGHANPWLFVVLFFGPVGGLIYLLSHMDLPFLRPSPGPRQASAQDVRRAEVDARRLDTAESWAHLASLHRSRGDFARAVDCATRATGKDPRHVDAQYELGLACLGGGRSADAIPPLRAVIARDPTYDSDDALFALARAEEQAGDLAAARASLEALAARRGRPEILFLLASVQARTGDRDASCAVLRRLIDEADYVPDYLQRNVKPWVKRARQALKEMGAETS